MARNSDNKKSGEMGDKGRMTEKLRLHEEKKQKEKIYEIYQDMLRKAKLETDVLAAALTRVDSDKQVTAMHKAKVEANTKDIFELNETTGPWVTTMT
eukprot:15596541-Heterocapsa_arctica.AAC.2